MLTPKMELFCLEVTKGNSQTEAYRTVYNCGNMKAASIHRKAKELMDNGKVTARIAELRAPAVEEARLTLKQHLENLEALRNAACSAGQYGAAVTAEVSRGKASGIYIDKAEIAGPGGIPLGIDVVFGKDK